MTKKIKIIYCYSSARLDTGSPRALLQMVDSLDHSHFTPAFFTTEEGSLTVAMRARNIEITIGKIETVTWQNPIKTMSAVREKMQFLKSINANILHMNEPGWNSDIVLAAKILGLPVAIHLHNPYSISYGNLNMRIAQRVFLCSAAQSKTVKGFNRIKKKTIVLHNAVDYPTFSRGISSRESIGVENDDLVIGTIAQISHRKGIDIFIDTAEILLARNRNLKFIIVGPQSVKEGEYYLQIMKRLQDQSLKGNVIYLGSRQDIPDLLASFDIFCLATRAEPFGMVIIEAMAAGVPVVASAVGGIPEIITDQSIGRLIAPLTADEFATNLDELIQMGENRKELGKRGQLSVKSRFGLANMGTTLKNEYLAMMSHRAA